MQAKDNEQPIPGSHSVPLPTSMAASFPRTIELRTIITPELLHQIVQIRCPWPKDSAITLNDVLPWSGAAPQSALAQLRTLCWPVLIALSRLGPDASRLEDLGSVLPAPETKKFPSQALALIILLDQIPRLLCDTKGMDARWVNDFFDPLALSFSEHLLALPSALQLYTHERWMSIGYSYEHYLMFVIILRAPLSHSESLQTHQTLRSMTEKIREGMHARSANSSIILAEMAAAMNDPLAFPRWVRAPAPLGPDSTIYDFVHYRLLLTDLHYSIIEQFGRFPWRNGAVGRADTEDEMRYGVEVGHFGEVREDVRKRIREDIEQGHWTALGRG